TYIQSSAILRIRDKNCLIISYLSNMLSCTLGQIIAHTSKGLPEKSNRERQSVALADTKATSTALTTPADEQVLLGERSAAKSSTLWQTLKPFGWQGLLLVAVMSVLYAPVLKILVRQWYNDADYSHGFLVP